MEKKYWTVYWKIDRLNNWVIPFGNDYYSKSYFANGRTYQDSCRIAKYGRLDRIKYLAGNDEEYKTAEIRTLRSALMLYRIPDKSLQPLSLQFSDAHNNWTARSWDLSRETIFRHIDTFISRCYNMIEICQSMIDFARWKIRRIIIHV